MGVSIRFPVRRQASGDRLQAGAIGSRQSANGKRQTANGKRQTAIGKRQSAGGRRQAAGGRQSVGRVVNPIVKRLVHGFAVPATPAFDRPAEHILALLRLSAHR